MKLRNKYFVMRHGQALSNVKGVMSCWPEKFHNPLTKKGRESIKKSAKKLENICAEQGCSIDLIFTSDILRTKQTAEIVGKFFGVRPVPDKRLREQNAGVLNGQSAEKLSEFFGPRTADRFKMRPLNGERYIDIEKRMLDFIRATDKKYKGKNILIVSHEFPILLLQKKIERLSDKDFYKTDRVFNKGEIRELN